MVENKETHAILAHILPKSQHELSEVKLGTRGGFSIFARKKPPLRRLFNQNKITFEQFIAGERLESLAYKAGIYAPSSMALGERVGGSGERKMSEMQLEAWSEYFAACKEISRFHGANVLQTTISVAVYGYSPMETQFLAINKRVAGLIKGLQEAHDFLFTPREVTAKI